jgi:plasmid maintenance system antidote protein VapI
MRQIETTEGVMGVARMAASINRGPKTIDRYIKGESAPSEQNAYKLALACGFTQEDALKIAKECTSIRARETA